MKLSVIVCTHNRAHAVIPCLDSIAASLAHAAPIDAEIVVVDNASTDNTSAIVREWAKLCAFPVQLLSEPQPGKSRACNRGIRASRGELLAFTDDDCRLSKEYVADLLRHDAADTEPVLRGGRVELGDPADLPISIKTEEISKRWHKVRHPHQHDLNLAMIGANMVMRQSVIEKTGFFDERFGPGANLPACEDIDYIFRAYLAGIMIERVVDMVIFHHHGRKTLDEAWRLLRNYAIGQGGQYAKYLFIDYNLCRPAYWDLRIAIREIFSGKNYYKPDMGFSYKNMMIYCLLGAFKFLFVSMKKPY